MSTLTSSTNLPPSLALALTELTPDVVADSTAFFAKVADKGFRRDLEAQADYSLHHHTYADKRRDEAFSFMGAGGLNPLSPDDKCQGMECRLAHAESFARLVALYTDYVVSPD